MLYVAFGPSTPLGTEDPAARAALIAGLSRQTTY